MTDCGSPKPPASMTNDPISREATLGDLERIERLIQSTGWKALQVLEPEFDLFEAVGVVVHENAASRALA